MSGNPDLRGPQDHSLVAGFEPDEVDYAARSLEVEFANYGRQQIENAIRARDAEPRFHNNQHMVMNYAR
jgi:hypothetical protein